MPFAGSSTARTGPGDGRRPEAGHPGSDAGHQPLAGPDRTGGGAESRAAHLRRSPNRGRRRRRHERRTNTTPLPAPVPSRSDLLAQMLALSADRASANEPKASIRTASLHLHLSLAKRRLAKERLAKERLAKERLAEARHARLHRQMAQRARAMREAAARQQQQQQQPLANPFAPPQALAQPAFGQQAAQQTR